MINGIFHQGSGLGNQLHRYVFTRVKAMDLGVDFGMANPELFKGSSFMNLHMGKTVESPRNYYFEEKVTNEDGVDIRPYDVKSEQIEPYTEVDGEFQDEKYWKHRENDVRRWLWVEHLETPEDLCVINFRGGEYVGIPELFLPQEYWDEAIGEMLKINPDMKFEVHTDDPHTAKYFFPHFNIIRDIAYNWRSVRYAKYLILSNSSFAILPSLLNLDVKKIIAPKFWAGHNKNYWQLEQNKYERFTYL